MAEQWVRRSLAGVMVIAAPTQTRVRRAVDLAVLNKRIREHFSAGKFDEAIPLAEKSMDLTHTQMGADHLDTAVRMGWLAELYRNQGRYPEAEPLSKRALAIEEIGPKHPAVSSPLSSLADLYRGILLVGISRIG